MIIEDGTGVTLADSYQTLADARTSAALLGLALPADDLMAEASLRNGFRYVNSFEGSMTGVRSTDTQAGSYPRMDSYYSYGRNKTPIDSDFIPPDLITAQMMAAFEYGKGTDIAPVDNGLAIASQEVVGAVKRSFHNTGSNGGEVKITQAIAALKPLLGSSSGSKLSVRTRRR